jgi:DNA helicase-2/ATP-dependent DNA helicase PcrA
LVERLKTDSIPEIVIEERDLLNRVQRHVAGAGRRRALGLDYDQELITLRDAIAEAKPEDIPPLVEQMTRLQALSHQRGRGEDIPVDPACPYFGHLALRENGEIRDVLIGKHTYLFPEDAIRIVDWRNAPVSRIYYSYDEGDEYEEEFGGRVRRGVINSRRSVTIQDGKLTRIADSERIISLKGDEWQALDPESSRLAGGQGTSIRAEGLSPVRGILGVDADGADRKDKHLPEIAALLDRRQFDLISAPASHVLVVKGGAGSGKTTVGLHRIAYLAFADARRFRPHRMLVVVLNEALVAYISRVLPALGVEGVRAMTFKEWALNQRRRHIRDLPTAHSTETPHVVSRLKRHPAMLSILDDVIDKQDELLTAQLLKSVAGEPDRETVARAWQALGRLPVDVRRAMLHRWIEGKSRLRGVSRGDLSSRTAQAVASALLKMARQTADVIGDWADLFTDRTALLNAFETHAPSEFTEDEIGQAHEWCVQIYDGLDEPGDEPPVIDQEDEAILLRLFQLKCGWLKGPGGRLLYDHLMLDEVQDFSHLEVAVLMNAVDAKSPVTLAGDTAQRVDRDSGFVSWDELLADIGVRQSRIVPLEVAYRSTTEVMAFSRDVLGPLAEEPFTAKRHGAPVELHRFSGPGQAVGFLGGVLRDLALREPRSNVAVIARHANLARTYYDGLVKAEIPRLNLVLDQDFTFSPGVEVTEIRQVKGLEFDYVVLVDVNRDTYPNSDESRHLLHVGATRAAHQLWIFVTGAPSAVLPTWIVEE